MNDEFSLKITNAVRTLDRLEGEYLRKAGLVAGQYPIGDTKNQLIAYLVERAAAEFDGSFVQAIKARTDLHPIDALTYYRYAQVSPETLSIYEATFRPRVVVCRPFKM